MSERLISGRTDGLITLVAADALWVGLTADSAVPTATGAFVCPSVRAQGGHVLLGSHVAATVRASSGQWSVPEAEVRRAAGKLNAVRMDRQDLVRIGPFHRAPRWESSERTPPPWRRRIMEELQELGDPERTVRREARRPYLLAGIDWRHLLVEQTRDEARRTWWLPRAVVRLLDAAEHAETQWMQAARPRQANVAATATEPRSHPRQAPNTSSRQKTNPDPLTPALRPYTKELEGQLYSVLSRKPNTSRKVAEWACAVCRTAPATVLDHCHEHGYVRAPVCQSCNTQERPDHLYTNDIRVANHYTRFFHTDTDTWLGHWHRCTGCRARTTLPLPHLAAWTAHTACRSLRPTHRAPRGRKPCGALRVSWTGSYNAPGSCLLTVAVDFCPSGEHRVLARVPYREAAERFCAWLAETAPAVAAAAGPDRLDGLPAPFRPVIVDTSGEDLELF
ncbi:endonuclease domain-containing protein [Streptomyces sp. ME02-7008A-1]|uniref:endonuclease domain-containing protein n=2 Tax=Streptomyces TaxID=1883 RepID=UPI0029A6DA68|nr:MULTISPECIES: endonuclease domain-containing protein [unclassified Streptomyces]MDX3186646.1 endonuclease domain-containing protein [Streptomyces sp. ME02-7008A-1]MDX3307390.1 endonuclease domain-containing protein [Streptomyces sp. ME02-7008A]